MIGENKMKKLCSLLLAICLLVSLSACGKCEEHKFLSSKYRVEKEATCTTEGIGVKVCGECGYEEKTTISVLKHNYIEIDSTQECAKGGKITYECSVCKDTYEKDGDALGHSWVAATCQKPKHCSRCNATEGEKAEHNFSGINCTVCGKENTKTVTCKGVKFIIPVEATTSFVGTTIKLTDISIIFKNGKFRVSYSVECIEKSDGSNALHYTLYDKDGFVLSSINLYATNLEEGEKAKNQSFPLESSENFMQGEIYKISITDVIGNQFTQYLFD